VRKFSTGEELLEEEHFKNKTLRFTNNNFVGGSNAGTNTNAKSAKKDAAASYVGGWNVEDKNKGSNEEEKDDELAESIEEEIIV